MKVLCADMRVAGRICVSKSMLALKNLSSQIDLLTDYEMMKTMIMNWTLKVILHMVEPLQ